MAEAIDEFLSQAVIVTKNLRLQELVGFLQYITIRVMLHVYLVTSKISQENSTNDN